jgi:SPP1 family predicted phage head-tail adaptor|tara:strand:- start:649 stop:984 length:336 start_codon:yes stop_codon:yes gene_type:complete
MIGKMRERIVIQKNGATRTNGVRNADSWTAMETVYARLRPLSARELRVADQNREIVSHEVTMRYRSDLGTDDTELFPRYRLLIGSRSFDVRSVQNVDFKNRITLLRAEEKV